MTRREIAEQVFRAHMLQAGQGAYLNSLVCVAQICWLGKSPKEDTTTKPAPELKIARDGVIGDWHRFDAWGSTADEPLGPLVDPSGKLLARNLRHVHITSYEETLAIAADMGLPASPQPFGLQREHVVLEGVPDMDMLVSGAAVVFFNRSKVSPLKLQVSGDARLTDAPTALLEPHYKGQSFTMLRSFHSAAEGRTGVVTQVVCAEPGGTTIARGDFAAILLAGV